MLAVNAGSSSIRFALYDVTEPLLRRLRGKIERIGLPDTTLTVDDSTGASRQNHAIDASDHSSATSVHAAAIRHDALYLRFDCVAALFDLAQVLLKRWTCVIRVGIPASLQFCFQLFP